MYVTASRMDSIKLNALCKDLFYNNTDINFTDSDIELVNQYVNNNDYNSFINYINSKIIVHSNLERETILSNIDNLWEYIVDDAYENYKNSDFDRQTFLSKLSPYERIAVQVANFDHQVCNGGLAQWDQNCYSDDLNDLKEFVSKCNFSKREVLLNIFESFSYVINSISKLNRYDDWYDADFETRINSLETHDKEYYRIKDSWKDYFEEYLLENIPDEYLKKIKENNFSKTNI